ncbi:hypothetical protein GCM10012320_27750 [Sinomonas cellulolyticus]|uniref:Lipoprotein n=1 Tax=Sinomonas cellulolyticus TaxID=2801916 RepID=A0ABS1K3M7_9MICC|nr:MULTISPECIES: hypothetical protein [Sinomonas]MBL0706235.1 hypothetical protein [Sinomonas cellulolyticus]GHG55718.1 hypothetical protein GCM10012320_27750 [Sinomonas sp. KCTC 49339]
MKPFLLPAITAAALLAGCSAAPAATSGPAPQPVSVQTQLPGLAAPTGEPDLPSLKATRPQPGQAVRADGAFDDRFEIDGLAFDGEAAAGAVRITSDVSDLLELVVVAGFYDRDGKLLTTARFEHHVDGDAGHQHAGPPSESEEFRIPVPAEFAGRAESAAVGAPVLVNE